MKPTLSAALLSQVVAGLLCAVIEGAVCAAEPASPPANPGMRILQVEGLVEVSTRSATNWMPARRDDLLRDGDRLRTGPASRAALRHAGLGTRYVGPNSELILRAPAAGQRVPVIEYLQGRSHFLNREGANEVELRNRIAAAGSEGTEFHVTSDPDGRMTLLVIEGQVQLRTAQGSLTLGAGEEGMAEAGQPPRSLGRRSTAEQIQRIQWCLHYPPVLVAGELALSDPERSALNASLAAYEQGDIAAARRLLPAANPGDADAMRIYRSALLLAAGDVEGADALLAGVAGGTGLAEALRQLVAAVQFREYHPPAPPATATGWLAESYYRQSRPGNRPEEGVTGALPAARRATELAPGSAAAWTRVAELEFSQGRTVRARQALDRALELAPDHPAALTLDGFVLAADNRVTAARERFERVLNGEGAGADAWLGRGLCRIRQGDLLGGRDDLLVAAGLEPRRAVLRSYLGKAFGETGDSTRALREYEIAATLDPLDPTSPLYAALELQGRNRVNEAIADLEHSKRLNDNRSVYRSGQLLDQDRAVRSANLARIYQDAGMDDVGFREAVRAVNSDHANYSAHLFLANSYEAFRDPRLIGLRYETPANTEYLLANLLAPVGAGVLSPALSQQEYSKLFQRDRPGFTGGAEYRSSGTWTADGSQYGVFGSSSYAIDGQYRSEAGEWDNGDLEYWQVSARIKQQLGPRDLVYVQGGYLEVAGGDVSQRYDPDAHSRTFRSEERQEPLLGVGYQHEWGPHSRTLLLAGWVRDRFSFHVASQEWPVLGGFGDADGWIVDRFGMDQEYARDLDVYSIEAQQILQTHVDHQTVVGARLQWGDLALDSRQGNPSNYQGFFPAPGDPAPWIEQRVSTELADFSVYGYHTWQVLPALALHGGLAWQSVELPRNHLYAPLASGEEDRDLLAPKGGFTWTPAPDTVVRAAYTSALTGVSLEQSYRLEPIQVAGFTQGYRSVIPESETGGPTPAAFIETYGLSVEQRLRTRTYLGLGGEILNSDADRFLGLYDLNGFSPAPALVPEELDYTEQVLTATVNQLLGDRWALGARYRLTHSELETRHPGVILPDLPPEDLANFNLLAPESGAEAWLHHVSLDALFNDPSGIFARLNALWFQQSNPGYTPDRPGDDFWQVNVMAGYRLPRRRAEITLGVLNLGDTDYRLNPLTPVWDLPRERTFFVRVRLNL